MLIRQILHQERLLELWRYGQAGLVNALFGFAMYSLFVRLGANIYVAQILAAILGIAFNYMTYTKHVFRTAERARVRFVLSYGVNYLVSLVTLALMSRVVSSAYAAGFLAIVITAAINYFALKIVVFNAPAAP